MTVSGSGLLFGTKKVALRQWLGVGYFNLDYNKSAKYIYYSDNISTRFVFGKLQNKLKKILNQVCSTARFIVQLPILSPLPFIDFHQPQYPL